MIPLNILNIIPRKKWANFINKGYCHKSLWTVIASWLGDEPAFTWDLITDGSDLIVPTNIWTLDEGFKRKDIEVTKIGMRVNGKKILIDYTSHFDSFVSFSVSYKVGKAKSEIIRKLADFDELCRPPGWPIVGIKTCKLKHKKDHCSGFVFYMGGKIFRESDFLKRKVKNIPYFSGMNKYFKKVNKLPTIVRPDSIWD